MDHAIFPAAVDLALAEHPQWQPDAADRYCGRCGGTLGPFEGKPLGCSQCAKNRLPWGRLVRLGAYQPPLSDWIVSMKFAGTWSWASWMGRRLAEQVRLGETPNRVAICPVPMAWSRRVRRGYNQAALIGEAMAAVCGWPLAPVLRRRRTPPQTTVPRSRRAGNVRRAFAARSVDLTGWTIWLVDDVRTTGATLHACALRLRAAGALRACVAVAAVADCPDYARRYVAAVQAGSGT